uniref:KIB1-4 beta-propeller domain-containing protein n=1 Tax=Leersia perrieri TaxID=77586 RepID=A0A0D9W289_9ORYZ
MPMPSPDWSSGLPKELLEIIAKKLSSGHDAAAFRSVCSPWRAALPFAAFVPLLMLPFDPLSPAPETKATTALTLYSLEKDKVFAMALPELGGKVVCGSSRGWLALMDEAASVTLLNPFTGGRVALPPADERVAAASSKTVAPVLADAGRRRWELRRSSGGVELVTLDMMRDVFFREIVLSSSPGKNSGDMVAMAVLADSSEVAFCRVGEKEWTLAETYVGCCICAVVHCQGEFIAIGCLGEISVISRIIAGENVRPPTARPMSLLPEPADMCHRSYLVLNGHLHLVGFALRVFHSEWPFDHQAVVYRCDLTAGETPVWSMVADVGDTGMFVSKYFSLGFGGASVSKIKRNCIYLSEPRYSDQGEEVGDHSPELVDLTTGNSEEIGNPAMQGLEALCWIRPNLWT